MRRLAAIAIAFALALTGTACARTGGGADGDWPAGQTMTMIVGYSAGGTTDTMARSFAAQLEKKLNTRIQVVNQDGAGGQRAYTAISTAKPDGLTFGTLNFPTILTTILDKSKGAPYTLDSFTPLANEVNDPRVTIVQPDSPLQNAQDLVAFARQHPKKLLGATSGLSGGGHFSMLKLEQATGTDFTPVHFNTGQAEAKAAFLGHHVDVYFASIGDGLEIIKSGQGRAVGVASTQRSTLLPDTPTFAEQGITIEESGRRGYALPAGVPPERVDVLAKAMESIINDPAHRADLARISLEPGFMGPAEYKGWLQSQMPEVARINELSKNDG